MIPGIAPAIITRSVAGGGGIQLVGYSFDARSDSNSAIDYDLTSLIGGIGTSPQEGDLVISCAASIVYGSIANQAAGADWTQTIQDWSRSGAFADNAAYNIGVAHKIMAATPDMTVPWSQEKGIEGRLLGMSFVFRGVDASTPMDVAWGVAKSTTGHHPKPPAITPVTPGALVLAFGLSGQPSPAPALDGDGNYASPVTVVANNVSVGRGGSLFGGIVATEWSAGVVTPSTIITSLADASGPSPFAFAATFALRPA